MKILILGVNGMAGHMISSYLVSAGHEIFGFDRKSGPNSEVKYIIGDARNEIILKNIIKDNTFDYIINCIGILNEQCDKNPSLAIYINSFLPNYLVELTRDTNTRIIHLSTDCVFSGDNKEYVENSFPDAASLYGKSKSLGEINDNKNLTFRTSIVGPDQNEYGIGLLNWFMKQEKTVNGYDKVNWTGITTLTLAKAINKAINNNLTGLYNLVNNESITKHDLLLLFNKYSGKNLIINKNSNVTESKILRSNRNDFDFKVPSYEQMVRELFTWINYNKGLYHYYE